MKNCSSELADPKRLLLPFELIAEESVELEPELTLGTDTLNVLLFPKEFPVECDEVADKDVVVLEEAGPMLL